MTSRRSFLVSTAAAVPLVGCASSQSTGTSGRKLRRPNIVLVITDDQGFGDLSCHGNTGIKTPHIDSLARDGGEFTEFIVCPVCAPTRSSLLTGRYNYRTGAIDTYIGRAMMHPDEITLAEVLRDAGYATGLFGKWHLGDNYPLRPQDQGFQEVLMHRGGGMAQPADPPNTGYVDPVLQHNGRQVQRKGYCSDVFTDAAIEFIQANSSQAFFAYVAFNAPHTPLQVPDEWVQPFRLAGLNDTTAKIHAMVENIDRNVGRLLATLRTLGLDRDTIFIFMTDNGPQQKRYNAGLRGLKGSVYDGGIRVPFFIRYPGHLTPGHKIGTVSAHIDIMPTLLGMCGVDVPLAAKFDGRSLVPLLKETTAAWPDRNIVIQWHRGDVPQPYNNCCVRNQTWKLVNGKELYDLKADPAESRDVASENPGVVQDLRAFYDKWFEDVTRDKRYEPPDIILGDDRENPSTLTRQDWRGPRAGWASDSLGHWVVSFARDGDYDITLRFPALAADATLSLKLPQKTLTAQAKKGDVQYTFARIALTAARGHLEPQIQLPQRSIGAHYVDVRRL